MWRSAEYWKSSTSSLSAGLWTFSRYRPLDASIRKFRSRSPWTAVSSPSSPHEVATESCNADRSSSGADTASGSFVDAVTTPFWRLLSGYVAHGPCAAVVPPPARGQPSGEVGALRTCQRGETPLGWSYPATSRKLPDDHRVHDRQG